MDLAFFGANIIKVPHGGWFPLVIGPGIYVVMATWKSGRAILKNRLQAQAIPLRMVLEDIEADPPHRVPGTAVYMVSTPEATPPALVHNLAHNKVLHEQVIFLSVLTEEIPHVPQSERVELENIGAGFHSVKVRYGFMQDPNIPVALRLLRTHGLEIAPEATTYFLGRETILASERPGMARWRERLFAFMSRNALRATAFFQIPPEQVFEVGVQVEI